jgi:hypothetical protein
METTHYRAELELLCCILLSPRLCNVLPEVVSTLPRSLVEKNLQPLLCLQHGSTAPFNHLPVHIKQFYSSSQQRLIFSLSLTPQPPIFFCTPHENQSAYTCTNTTFDLPELGSIRGNKRRSASKKGSSENNLHLSNVINDNRIMMVVGGRGKVDSSKGGVGVGVVKKVARGKKANASKIYFFLLTRLTSEISYNGWWQRFFSWYLLKCR